VNIEEFQNLAAKVKRVSRDDADLKKGFQALQATVK
jgi:hypothetical protein